MQGYLTYVRGSSSIEFITSSRIGGTSVCAGSGTYGLGQGGEVAANIIQNQHGQYNIASPWIDSLVIPDEKHSGTLR